MDDYNMHSEIFKEFIKAVEDDENTNQKVQKNPINNLNNNIKKEQKKNRIIKSKEI